MAVSLVRLKKRADFLRVAAGRNRAVRAGFILQGAPRPESAAGSDIRVGFTASRKVGNAVARNRAKRRLRGVSTEILPRSGRSNTDYVLIARAATAARPYAELLADLETALRQVHRPRRGSGGPAQSSRERTVEVGERSEEAEHGEPGRYEPGR